MHTTREIINAIFYVVRGGCAWRLLPNDFPPWKTVYHYFRFWRLDGTWERMHAALRRKVRVRLKRVLSAQRRDSGQPVGQNDRGGRRRTRLRRGQEGEGPSKRHLLVDTQGLVLMAKVHNANVTDRDGIKLLLEPARTSFLKRLSHLWLDAGYTGQDRGAGWVEKTCAAR